MVFGFALLCPRAARAWESWHGQSGHLPISFFRGTGKAGIEKIAGRQAKPGTGTGTHIPHHYCKSHGSADAHGVGDESLRLPDHWRAAT